MRGSASVSEVERGAETGGGEQLLVVDDDPFIARLLEIELAAAGYRVRVANDGQQALDLIRADPPDLVVTDVMMPHVDGFELTRLLRQDPRTAAISVIILTARGLSADKLEGFAIGADDYIVKPFDTPELLARVRGVLRRSKEMKDESPLTGLPGNVRIQEEIELKVASGAEFALLYADIDHFKAFNDHYGFARGDNVIRDVGELTESVLADLAPEDSFVGTSRRRRFRARGVALGGGPRRRHDRPAVRSEGPELLRRCRPRTRMDRGAEPARGAATVPGDHDLDRHREHPAAPVRALRGGRGGRDRDEELHEVDARIVVGDRPPHHLADRRGAQKPGSVPGCARKYPCP